MEELFTESQLKNMSQESLEQLVTLMQENLAKLATSQKLLDEKVHELEFLNALLSDRLLLAQKKQFGRSSEKYAEGFEQLGLFNEAEQEADPDAPEPEMEEVHPAPYKRKKRTGKKEEDLSAFPVTETIENKLPENEQYCPDCGRKYKVFNTESTKTLKFIPAHFEVREVITYIYNCPDCGNMARPEKDAPLLKGSIASPSLVAGIMNAKYVSGMPLARQEREFARYDLMVNWVICCAERYLQPVFEQVKEEFLRCGYVHGDELCGATHKSSYVVA